jgi:hypothetical protein
VTFLPSLDAESVALLRDLCGPHGIHASRSSTANYRAVFARDAVMAGVAGLLLRDEVITAGLVRTLEHLRQLQGPEGQVASNFEMRDAGPHVSFGTLAPRIDAATWYLVGIGLAARAGAVDPADYRDSVQRAVHCLNALEYNGRHLMYIPTGGNWADEYIYDGYILYDQVLRAWALRLLGATYGEPAWLDKSQCIADTISERFFASDKTGPQRPIAAYTPVHRHEMFDLAACALLAVSGIAQQRAQQALAWIDQAFLQQGALPPVFHPVIEEGDAEWPALRRYHLHAFRNLPYEYHNGGIWPIWLGWLALGQVQTGHHEQLPRLRREVLRALGAAPSFEFEEYLHGRTGAAGGTPHMAYTATGLLFLHLAGSDAPRELLAPSFP